MITLLAKIFIKNYKDYHHPAVRFQYGILCGIVGILFNVFLFLLKLTAGFFSHSIAITADAFNNLSDAGSSFITLIGFKLASEKPDKNHPYGHGRMEYLAGLIVSFFIILMSFELFQRSIHKILTPELTQIHWITIGILLISILVKLYIVFYSRRIGAAIQSATLEATAIDSRNDCIATFMILLGSFISNYTNLCLDGYFGLIVAVLIFLSGIQAAKDTINPLLGQAPDPAYIKKIEALVLSHPIILGVHDILVHDYGPGRVVVSLHAEVPSSGNLLEMHDLIDHIEKDLATQCNCEAVIHMDPVLLNDPETEFLKSKLTAILNSIDPALNFHDFRIVKEPDHTNILFDLLVPYKFSIKDENLIVLINEELKKGNSSYETVIKIDHSYL